MYVLEVDGGDVDEYYVGQSWRPAEVRRQQHIDGVRRGRIFKRRGRSVGRLRFDLVLTDASVEDEGVAQGDDDEGLNVTDGEHVDVRLGWPVVIVSPA